MDQTAQDATDLPGWIPKNSLINPVYLVWFIWCDLAGVI